jgi:hypothetical protein
MKTRKHNCQNCYNNIIRRGGLVDLEICIEIGLPDGVEEYGGYDPSNPLILIREKNGLDCPDWHTKPTSSKSKRR